MNKIVFQNSRIELEFSVDPEFRLEYLRDRSSGKTVCRGRAGKLYADRRELPEAVFRRGRQVRRNCYQLEYACGDITIYRSLFLYDDAPAFRYYDVLCGGAADLAGMYYSGIFEAEFPGGVASGECVHFFNCTDQSNHRLLRNPAAAGKNVGSYFLTDGLFLYKEGPQPDSRPIKGEYDFLCDPVAGKVEMVGLGFDNLRSGEERRVFGAVVGLRSECGLQDYQLARYGTLPPETLSNSWPELETGVSEALIARELEMAAESGIGVVFIDDGYFKEFMGEIDTEKFPNRFYRLAEQAGGLGVELGLWVNPLGLDTNHPKMRLWDGSERADVMVQPIRWNFLARTDDFVHTEMYGDCTAERSYCPVELLNMECFEFMKEKLSGYHREYGIRHFKFDLYQLTAFNTLLGDAQLHYEAYRRLIDELVKAVPELVISMDCTRRNRPAFDFALDYGRIFMENRGRRIPDHRYYHPYVALANFHRLAAFVPAHRIELEMMPHAMEYPLLYILGTTVFATALYWGVIANCPEERRRGMKRFFDECAPLRRIFARSRVIPLGEAPERGNWNAILSQERGSCDAYLAVYRHGAAEDSFTPSGVERYRVCERVLGDGTAAGMVFEEKAPFAFSLYRLCNL